MDAVGAINSRRSTRKFKPDPIPDEILRQIIEAGLLAPSAKNAQPWKFVVVSADKRDEMVSVIKSGFEREKSSEQSLLHNRLYSLSANNTLKIMSKAPVSIFIFNRFGKTITEPRSTNEYVMDVTNLQSIGAAIENMILAAQAHEIGSLWICDVFFAYQDLCQFLKEDTQMVAALSLGYKNEFPSPRPRLDMNETVKWI